MAGRVAKMDSLAFWSATMAALNRASPRARLASISRSVGPASASAPRAVRGLLASGSTLPAPGLAGARYAFPGSGVGAPSTGVPPSSFSSSRSSAETLRERLTEARSTSSATSLAYWEGGSGCPAPTLGTRSSAWKFCAEGNAEGRGWGEIGDQEWRAAGVQRGPRPD